MLTSPCAGFIPYLRSSHFAFGLANEPCNLPINAIAVLGWPARLLLCSDSRKCDASVVKLLLVLTVVLARARGHDDELRVVTAQAHDHYERRQLCVGRYNALLMSSQCLVQTHDTNGEQKVVPAQTHNDGNNTDNM